jgi:UDP-3-O-[3-hydroxymyristoyl] glucosamine N-acyltransferase
MEEPAPIAGDPRFFERAGPYTLAALAEAAGGTIDAAQAGRLIVGVGPLQSAGPELVSFLDNRRYLSALEESRAGAVLVLPALADRVPAGCVAIVTREPYLGWARVAAMFHPLPPVRPGIHPLACVAAEAEVDPSAEIGPFVVIEAGARIGAGCRIGPGAVIGAGVVLGQDCRVGAHASLSHTLAGARVYVYPGARIGQEGFGFTPGPAGFVTVPQLGRVVLGDDVEVGANSAIDRGSAQDTVIGAGTRIDNLVQIGHNVRTGRCCVLVGQSGVAGSVVLEDFVTLAGQAGIAGHIRIGKGARVGAQAGVMGDLAGGLDYLGSPAVPARDSFRQTAAVRRLTEQLRAERHGQATRATEARRATESNQAGDMPASKADTD